MYLLIKMLGLWFSLTLGLATEPAQQPTEVYLLIGQSNMAGRAAMVDADTEPIPGVLLLNSEDTWEPARQPLNRYATDHKGIAFQRFNLGGPFAKAIRAGEPGAVPGLIVNARGGTRIELWQRGEDLYENALDRVRALEDVELAGVLWHQGESNRDDEAYGEKLERLVLSLRADLDQPDLPLIAGHISGKNRINEQMDEVAKRLPHMRVVSVEGLTLFDGIHYDRDSLIDLGRRYAEAYKQLTSD